MEDSVQLVFFFVMMFFLFQIPFLDEKKEGDFDHSIYIANGTIAAAPSAYTEKREERIPNAALDDMLRLIPNGLLTKPITSMSRIKITGDFANNDYLAFSYV